MPKKSYAVDVHLDIHTIKCPGVWLCPKGHVCLGLKLFKAKEKTRQLYPHFPLMVNQRFHFRKIFNGINSYSHLNKVLANTFIKAELVQIPNTTYDNVILAKFKASLMEVVNPEETMCEVDFLFASTDCFPGIISPKAEVSTSIVMEEFVALSSNIQDIPVTISSKHYDKKCSSKKIPARQKKVCHTQGYPCSCYRSEQHYAEVCQRLSHRRRDNEAIESFESSSDSKHDHYVSYKCTPSLLCEPVVNSFLVDELPSGYQKKEQRRSLSEKRFDEINEPISEDCSCALCQRYEMYIQEQMKEEMQENKKEPKSYYMDYEGIDKSSSNDNMIRDRTQPSVIIKQCTSKKRASRPLRGKSRTRSPPLNMYNSNNYSTSRRIIKNPTGISRPSTRNNSSPLYKRSSMRASDKGDKKGCPFHLLNCNCGGKDIKKRRGVSNAQLGRYSSAQKGKWLTGRSRDQRSPVLHIKSQKRISRRSPMKADVYNARTFGDDDDDEPCKLLMSDNERPCDCNNPLHCQKHNCRKYENDWSDERMGGPSNGTDGRRISMCGKCITPTGKSKKKKRQRWAIPNSALDQLSSPGVQNNCDCRKVNRGGRCKCMEYL